MNVTLSVHVYQYFSLTAVWVTLLRRTWGALTMLHSVQSLSVNLTVKCQVFDVHVSSNVRGHGTKGGEVEGEWEV